jgi:hypothetical protein
MSSHRSSANQHVTPTNQQRKAARMLAHGASFTDALRAAGYSPAQARKGFARVVKSKGLMAALQEEMKRYPPEVRRDLVRLRLLQNLFDGEDRATKSARLLGLDNEVRMWQDEQQNQVLVIQAPVNWNGMPNYPMPEEAEPVSECELPNYE